MNGVRIDPLTHAGFLRRIQEFLECGRSHIVHFIPADPTVVALDDLAYRRVLNDGDLNVADGVPVAWTSRLMGYPTVRIAGIEAMTLLLRWGISRGLRHYMFGSTTQVLRHLDVQMRRSYSGVEIVGKEAPPFRELMEGEYSEATIRVRDADADLLWIGLGTPKQDHVAEQLRTREAAPVILCVGAAFDFGAGTKRRAPEWMQKTGLEWVHRLASEPRRLWHRYLVGNPRFVMGVVKDMLSPRPYGR